MEEAARSATEFDLDDVVGLAREGRAEVANARGGGLWLERDATPEPLDHAFSAAISSPEALLLVGTIDAVPLGFLLVEIEPLGDTRLAICREVFVTPPARGVGLGESMMREALAWAASVGAMGMDGYALPGDRATKNFFERFGLTARGIVVHRPIEIA